MKILLLLLASVHFGSFASCNDLSSQLKISEELFVNDIFRDFACPLEDCTKENFHEKIDFASEKIDRVGLHEACRAEAKIKPKNLMTAIYLTDDAPAFQFMHFGYVSFTQNYYKNRKVISATEIEDGSTEFQITLRWNGRFYEQKGGVRTIKIHNKMN